MVILAKFGQCARLFGRGLIIKWFTGNGARDMENAEEIPLEQLFVDQ